MRTEKVLFFLAGFLCLAATLSAQHSVITGKVIDADDKSPVPFANILLLKADSTFIAGVSTDMDGQFRIEDSSPGENVLSVSYVGYETVYVNIATLPVGEPVDILLHPSSITLHEAIIQAHAVIVKDDRKVILPTQEQIRTSTDGTDILRKIQLPRLMVDHGNGEITLSGNGEIQLRINGVQVTEAEIASILPADILRIEYHDSPGVRYGNAAAVIDYITRRKDSGGNVNGSFLNGVSKNKTSATDRIAVRYNKGNSEFSANAMYIQRQQDWTREYDETLYFPTYEIHRMEIGEPTPFNKKVFTSNLSYSLMENGAYFFNAQIRYNQNDFPNGGDDRKSKLYTSETDSPLSITDHTVEKSHSPSVDLYYQRDLQHDRLLIFNVVGTYIDTHSKRIYQEKRGGVMETDILSDITGDKYSLIAEGFYEKKQEANKITAGARHLQAYTSNHYRESTIANVSMRQAESCLYAEYQGKRGAWGCMANLTAMRLYYSQKGNHTQKYTLQPAARITFESGRDLYFRYSINLCYNAPSLAALNDVEQPVDAWIVRRGNPTLSAFHTLSQQFTAGYVKSLWGVDLLVSYDHEYNPIMESLLYEDGKFVRLYENQCSFQNFTTEATFRVKPWKEHINLSVTPVITRFISKGNKYLHTYTMHELRVNLDLVYANWIANFTTITPPRFMYGEQLFKNNQMYTLMAGYKQPKWSLMIGATNPFTAEYKGQNRNWSALNPVNSSIHTKNNKAFVVKLNINLNYGKQFYSSKKRTHHTDTESGIMQGAKQ